MLINQVVISQSLLGERTETELQRIIAWESEQKEKELQRGCLELHSSEISSVQNC